MLASAETPDVVAEFMVELPLAGLDGLISSFTMLYEYFQI
jgi:hypothetical protein